MKLGVNLKQSVQSNVLFYTLVHNLSEIYTPISLTLYFTSNRIKKLNFLRFTVLLALLGSCNGDKQLPDLSSDQLETKRVEMPNGEGYEIISYYRDTIKHGKYELYKADGSPDRKGYYYNDSMAGRWVFYDSNSTIRKISFYRQNLPNGMDSVFYPNGNLMRTGVLNKGLEQGPWEYYNEDGSLKSRIIFADGRPIEGSYESYETKS